MWAKKEVARERTNETLIELDDLSLSSMLLGYDLDELSGFQGFGLRR